MQALPRTTDPLVSPVLAAGPELDTITYDGQDIIREIRSGVAAYTYIHGPGIDEPLARLDGSGAAYYHADGLGSIVAMTDDTGAVVSTRRYDAWGNLELGASEPGYAFTAREWDPETGLYYYRARYYDPKVGRFISEDPIGTAGGPNMYVYVGDRPANGWDPLGLVDFSGKSGDVEQAYVQQDRLLREVSTNKKLLDYFAVVFEADLKEYLTPGKHGTFALSERGSGTVGHCNAGWPFPLNPDMYLNMSYDLFGGDGQMFRATLIHELAHLADRDTHWSGHGDYPYTKEDTERARVGQKMNPFDGWYGYYAEVYYVGRVITPSARPK
jgi:RHS repeat-associated protein